MPSRWLIHLTLDAAREVLGRRPHRLEDVKTRVLEFLAVRKMRAERGMSKSTGRGAVPFPLVAPPGVGKTSPRTTARALGRVPTRCPWRCGTRPRFVATVELTAGAALGRIVRAIEEATTNPAPLPHLIHQKPVTIAATCSSALLEVLDPAVSTASGPSPEVELDLSQVFVPQYR